LPAVDTDETESRYVDRLVRRQVQS